MKKSAALLLTAAMAAMMIAGCGSDTFYRMCRTCHETRLSW